ncbi:WYL domain-containing protein [bacterium]|nr:WYL domain-containing protein [bacterium]
MADETMLTRALRILHLLSTHENVTVKQLYDYFDRKESKQTLQRTLMKIDAANIPLKIEAGAHNEKYYSLDRAFKFIPELLTAEEALAAVLLVQFREVFAGTRIETDMATVFEKLHQLLPPDAIAAPDAFSGTYLHVHQPGKLDLADRADMLRDLFHSIVQSRVVKVQYRSKRYRLHPYSLLIHNGTLYVLGQVPPHTDTIYLALSRFKSVELTEDTFVRDESFSLSEVLRSSFGIWYEKPVDVVIRFDKTVVPSIESRRWHPTQSMSRDDEGNLTLRMHLGPSKELIAWILRWGQFAEVLEPSSLRKEMAATIKEMSRNYRKLHCG